MKDLKLKRREDCLYDLDFASNDLQVSDDLENLVIISLGSDSRKTEGFCPNILDGGWWGAATLDVDWGNRLCDIFSNKNGTNLRLLAEQYIKGSLKWLVDDSLLDSVSVVTSILKDKMLIEITAVKDSARYSYNFEQIFRSGDANT